jgi:hypothetical protein
MTEFIVNFMWTNGIYIENHLLIRITELFHCILFLITPSLHITNALFFFAVRDICKPDYNWVALRLLTRANIRIFQEMNDQHKVCFLVVFFVTKAFML